MVAASAGLGAPAVVPPVTKWIVRFVGWCVVAMLFAFLIDVYLTFWQGWPGAGKAFTADSTAASWVQVALYALAVAVPAVFVSATPERSLRRDDAAITAIAAYVARFAFWTVLLVGLVDGVVSFLRVEGGPAAGARR